MKRNFIEYIKKQFGLVLSEKFFADFLLASIIGFICYAIGKGIFEIHNLLKIKKFLFFDRVFLKSEYGEFINCAIFSIVYSIGFLFTIIWIEQKVFKDKEKFRKSRRFINVIITLFLIFYLTLYQPYFSKPIRDFLFESSYTILATTLTYLIISWGSFKEMGFFTPGFKEFSEAVKNCDTVFMTSIMPSVIPTFKRRFSPDMVRQKTVIAGNFTTTSRTVSNSEVTTLIIYDDTSDFDFNQLGLFDGEYAKKYAKMYSDLGFDLAYISKRNFIKLLSDNNITIEENELRLYDFAEITRGKETLYFTPASSINKKNMTYKFIDEPNTVGLYKNIKDVLFTEIHDNTNKLKKDYNLCFRLSD